jgi:hypothetical protein
MEKNFMKLWFNYKEYKIFIYLTEYWISASSEISKSLKIPKSTVNFIADNLWKKWYLKKSFRWNTGYYEVEIEEFKKNIFDEIEQKQKVINDIIPLLKEKNKNTISKPKIIFIDQLENCKKAYSKLLNIKWKFYEFWAHTDLENAFWKEFMSNFIKKRTSKNILCDAICIEWEVENILKKNENKEFRKLENFSKKFWKINSTIVIYDNNVLILNLNWIYTWVLIENNELAETMKTIFRICKR